MRNFVTSMLGALTALIVFFAGLCFFGIIILILISAAAHRQHETSFEKGSYLVFDMDANIDDAPPQFSFNRITGDQHELQLRLVTRAIEHAAHDPRIAGIYLTGSLQPSGYGSSFAALREVRSALLDFRASGKPVLAYLSDADTRDYYLASAATNVALDPYGMIFMPGLAARPMFYTGFFEKFGIGVQVTRVGKYKSAVEPFIRKDLSPENRQQLTQLLGDIWGGLLGDISASRKIKVSAIQSLVDREGMIRPEAAKAAGLVDRIAYRDVMLDDLKSRTGRAGSRLPFRQVSLESYIPMAAADSGALFSKGRVAVVYAEGDIVDGEGEPGQIGGDRFARELRRLREDNSVKAVVLRVNSPGGSASAAEAIQREIRLLKKRKPVIVSMGGYAASGGYWISAYGNRIFAEPTTITGSIGVFGMFFDVQKLAESLGFTFDTVKTGRFADAMTITRPKTPDELAVIQRMIDWIYDQFVDKVAAGRGLSRADVEQIAQGRVWSGTEAVKLKLVDQIGGLNDAIRYAGERAGLGANPALVEYPRRKTLGEVMTELFQKMQPMSAHAAVDHSVVGQVTARLNRELSFLRSCNDPQGAYARLPLDIQPR